MSWNGKIYADTDVEITTSHAAIANSCDRDCHYVVPVFDTHIGEIC